MTAVAIQWRLTICASFSAENEVPDQSTPPASEGRGIAFEDLPGQKTGPSDGVGRPPRKLARRVLL